MPGYLCWGHPEDWATDPVLSRAYCEGRIAQIRANEAGTYPASNKHVEGTPEHYAFQAGLDSWVPWGVDQPPDCCAELPRLGDPPAEIITGDGALVADPATIEGEGEVETPVEGCYAIWFVNLGAV